MLKMTPVAHSVIDPFGKKSHVKIKFLIFLEKRHPRQAVNIVKEVAMAWYEWPLSAHDSGICS